MTEKQHYDLIVIGGGPAGEKGAARAAYNKKRVALIEQAEVLGGTVLSAGIPAKALREAALSFSGFRKRDMFGVDLQYQGEVDVQTFMRHEREVRTAAQNASAINMQKHGVERYRGIASFVDAHTIAVDCAPDHIEITGDYILIATGSRPFRPSHFPFHHPRLFDATTILSMHTLPRRLAIIGGGIIGSEFAGIFGALGIEVHLVHSQDRFFSFADHEISDLLFQSLTDMDGMNLHLSTRVETIEVTDDRRQLLLQLNSGEQLSVDTVLASTGRIGNTEGLNLTAVGVNVSKRGHIAVNEFGQTAVSHIYAAGDVIGFPALASTSIEQARTAATHAFQSTGSPTAPPIHIPYGLWTVPEVSMVGETEQSLQAKNQPYIVGRAYYNENPRGMVLGEKYGLLKLIFEPETLKLLGAHIIGQSATDLIAIAASGLQVGADCYHFLHIYFNLPSLAVMYQTAAYDALGKHDLQQAAKLK